MPDWRLMVLVVDWATIASLLTAAGTLVLAIATFSAVRSSNRSARIAEAALQEQRRPILAPSRLEDPRQKIMFLEGRWVTALGGRAVVEHDDGIVYLAISLRNVGAGIAVCQGWVARPDIEGANNVPHAPLEEFRLQSRDLYIPAGDIGMWQGALRNPDDLVRAHVVDAVEHERRVLVELLYSDQVGHQQTISRFSLQPAGDMWFASVVRHWSLETVGPRPDSLSEAGVEAVLRDREAAVERRAAADARESPQTPGEVVTAVDSVRPGAESFESRPQVDSADSPGT